MVAVNFFLALSVIGSVISMTLHLLAVFAGLFVGSDVISAMLMGCLVIAVFWLFARRDADGGDGGALPWRSIVSWPWWLKLILGALFLYVVWFCLAHGVPMRWSVGSAPLSPLLVQASCLVLSWSYAFFSALLYDVSRRAPRGPFQ